MVVVAEIHVIAGRERELRKDSLQITLAHHDQLLGLMETEWLQQHRVDHREDRRIRPDAERQGENGDYCEARIALQGPESILQVAEKGSKHDRAVRRRGTRS